MTKRRESLSSLFLKERITLFALFVKSNVSELLFSLFLREQWERFALVVFFKKSKKSDKDRTAFYRCLKEHSKSWFFMQIAHFWTKKSESFFHKERVALVFEKVKRVILSFALVVFFLKQRERFAPVDFLERATRAIHFWRSLSKDWFAFVTL